MLARRSLTAWAGVLGLGTVLACGPFFPENALNKPKGILQPPLFEFTGELYELTNPLLAEALASRKPGSPAYTLELEMAEMEKVMQDRLTEAGARQKWLDSYRALRAGMIRSGDRSDHAMSKAAFDSAPTHEKIWDEQKVLLKDAPEDIRLYLEGARLYLDVAADAAGPMQQAQEKWLQLLALPKERRSWRSTWAAWMMFRTSNPTDDAACGRWLSEVRKLSLAGFADSLHLGIEATYILGRPGSDLPEKTEVSSTEWKRAAYLRAILGHSRGEENLRNDRWQHATWSEALAAQTLADPFLRQAQLLNLIEVAEGALGWTFGDHSDKTAPLGEDLGQWLKSYEEAGLKEQKEAGLLAWLYYNAARFEEAKRWLKMAPENAVMTLSLKGKLAAMEGRKPEMVKSLAAMAKLMPEADDEARAQMEIDSDFNLHPLKEGNYRQVRRHYFLADYGMAQIAVNDFTGALQTFSKTDFWFDTAYIAERLIPVEDLLSLVRKGRISETKPGTVEASEQEEEPVPEMARSVSQLESKYSGWSPHAGVSPVRYLLARRLAREQYFKNAVELLPRDLGAALAEYRRHYRQGHDKRLPKAQRAEALWTAAQLHRRLGMELFGFECGPDGTVVGGAYEMQDMAAFRAKAVWVEDWGQEPQPEDENQRPLFKMTKDELWRARDSAPKVNKRFHYRYVAAELAWQAAALMPDDNEKTAEVLCIAGNWLKVRDPVAADRFYKALVRRNPSVALAQQAAARRWLPDMRWDFDLNLTD